MAARQIREGKDGTGLEAMPRLSGKGCRRRRGHRTAIVGRILES
jgi:hypothetical protein